VFYNHATRQALGFQNPCYLKKAQQLKPILYDDSVIGKSDVVVVPDFEDTLMHAEESRSKMIEKQNDPQMIEKKELFNQCLIDEVTEVQNIFKQIELAVEQHYAEKTKFQTKMENVLQENDRLLTHALSVEIVNTVLHYNVKFDYLNRDTVSSLESALTFAELFKINDLKAQVQAKDTVILKLKEKLNSFSGDVKERKVKREVEEIETLNLELDHKVTKLAAENEHLKQTYKHCDDLINKVNLKSVEVSDLNASLQEKLL
nr:hypothetical protein [Tanacetum cinerariifolium]